MRQIQIERDEQALFPVIGCSNCDCSNKKKCCKKYKKKGIHCKKCPKV